MTRRADGERPTGRRRGRRTPRDRSDGAPRSLSEEVEAQADQDLEDGPAHTPTPQEESELDFTPQGRLEQVAGRGGSYEKEYRLSLLHRLLMRRIPLDQIAEQLGVSTRTVQRLRTELFTRLRKEAKDLDLHKFIGDTFAFYSEVQAMALRGASAAKTPLNIRLAAMRTAMSSRDHLVKFLGDAGVLDALKFEPNKEDGLGDLAKVVKGIDDLLKTDLEKETGLTLPEGSLPEEEDEEVHLF